VWEFKQIEDLYLRIVATHNLFIEFMHQVWSTTRLPIESRCVRTQVFLSPTPVLR